MQEKGNISVHTENIFPIIKKWLYSDKDIFIRELVSNGCDAINKLKKLSSIGKANVDEGTDYFVKVVFDKDAKTLKFIDNGIGMTAEEVKKYINQVAFSGAEDFIKKYEETKDQGNQIIGHFGLGFYSAFMVSDKVEIDTLSHEENAKGVRWTSEGGIEYHIEESDHTERGTTITLHIAEDSTEFLEEFKLREILMKYCSFLPIEIYLENANSEEVKEEKSEKEVEGEDVDKEDSEEDLGPKPINTTAPLWLKNPADCTDEEYKEFYRTVFADFNEPLFWIHLNVDYPFNLKGILYFPKLKHEFDGTEGSIKLYNNQVFVADNIKEVIPEFLLSLKGVIDCPDLPLNVSRSFLQNDGYVMKISNHITRKVADKLISLFKTQRKDYNKYWDDINPFVKYGCMRDDKFYDRVKDVLIYKTINGEYITLEQYLENNESKNKDKVFYVSNENQQAQYINLFKDQEMDAVILSTPIDNHFMQFLEMKQTDIKFNRIDSDISEGLKDDEKENKDDKKVKEDLEKIFKEALNDDKLKIQVENLNVSGISGMILLSEQSRRMQEMSLMFGGGMDMKNMFPEEQTLVLNKNNNLIKHIIKLKDDESKKEDLNMICNHIYDLAMLSHKQLEPEAMTKFIERSNDILEKVSNI